MVKKFEFPELANDFILIRNLEFPESSTIYRIPNYMETI